VVSGTSFPSLAGLASMNIHGKNNFAVGTIGAAILEFDIMLPSGELRTCSREQSADLFFAAIGGLGMLGIFTRIKLKTMRVHSGNLWVHAYANRNLRDLMDYMQSWRNGSDYLVAWVDCFATGKALGRGAIHRAHYMRPGEDSEPEHTRSLAYQDVKPNVLGVIPKGELWRPLRLLNNDLGFRFINAVKYHLSRFETWCKPKLWTLNEFSFLLDYVPNWKWSYGRKPGHGLIQFQPFVPDEAAHEVFSEILRRSQAVGHTPYLGVIKRHRPDPFLLTHAVDGWSFALDYKVTPETREPLFAFFRELGELVLAAGGKFYFAKDSILAKGAVERMYPAENLAAFRALKQELDPDGLLATDLWRRVFA
jgi:decaprenylphospho-beta-D-ribofuranose 2-oxidase